MNYQSSHAVNARFLELADELSAGCDADFDSNTDDLEREFAELRCLTFAEYAR